MPAHPTYLHRLPAAIDALGSLQVDWIDRRLVEELLGVSKWTALRILKASGAGDGPGGALVCSPERFAAFLRLSLDQEPVRYELRRRSRVEEYLESMARVRTARDVSVATGHHARVLGAATFASLPPGVTLDPGLLRIEFQGLEDLLRKVAAVVYAAQNDTDALQRYLECTVPTGAPD